MERAPCWVLHAGAPQQCPAGEGQKPNEEGEVLEGSGPAHRKSREREDQHGVASRAGGRERKGGGSQGAVDVCRQWARLAVAVGSVDQRRLAREDRAVARQHLPHRGFWPVSGLPGQHHREEHRQNCWLGGYLGAADGRSTCRLPEHGLRVGHQERHEVSLEQLGGGLRRLEPHRADEDPLADLPDGVHPQWPLRHYERA
mmetsp:Transcript_80817/g.187626  ORF Transcript_80817/g.187626 Transcript_80817/m.187626 type:complete len:200 (+) Transcript_80817:385-984(+)